MKITKTIKIIFSVAVLLGATFGNVYTARAASGFAPLQAGVNFQAGWGGGLHTDADNAAIIDNIAAQGLKWVRIDIGWSTIEYDGDIYGSSTDPTATYPSSASNHWYIKKIDYAVNYAKSKGINVLGIWWTTPPWNTDGAAGKSATTRPAGYPSYPEYSESAEWAAKYWAGRIDSWEIWNESDPGQSFWQAPDGSYGGTQYYAELLKAVYPAIKRGNSNAKVLTSGASSIDTNWISQLYGYGIKNYFDVMAIHTYEGMANNDPLNSDGSQVWNFLHVPDLRQTMVDNGDTDKPIWITEMGYSTHVNTDLTGDSRVDNWNLGVTEQQQGDYMVKAIDYANKNWPYTEVFIIYNDKDLASSSGSAETSRHQKNFGLMYTNNNPKPGLGIIGDYIKSSLIDGDLNRDGKVDIFDLSVLLSVWDTVDSAGDINHDHTVNAFDLSILLSNWSK